MFRRATGDRYQHRRKGENYFLKADKILLKISSAALNIILASSMSGDP